MKNFFIIDQDDLYCGGDTVRSYIKIFGPPILEALKTLEKIAIDMPEVCIMDLIIRRDLAPKIAGKTY